MFVPILSQLSQSGSTLLYEVQCNEKNWAETAVHLAENLKLNCLHQGRDGEITQGMISFIREKNDTMQT